MCWLHGLFDRVGRLFRANPNDLVSQAEDPSRSWSSPLLTSDLIKLRQAVATAIASQKRIQNQAEQAENQAQTWYRRASWP